MARPSRPEPFFLVSLGFSHDALQKLDQKLKQIISLGKTSQLYLGWSLLLDSVATLNRTPCDGMALEVSDIGIWLLTKGLINLPIDLWEANKQ